MGKIAESIKKVVNNPEDRENIASTLGAFYTELTAGCSENYSICKGTEKAVKKVFNIVKSLIIK